MPKITFKSTVYTIGGWTIVRLPKEASAQLPSRGQVMVNGDINGTALQTPLEPDGTGSHWFNIDEALQSELHIAPGDNVTLTIEATKNWPEPEIPADVKKAISQPDIQPLWARVTPMARWEWLRWINSTSKAETRQKRIEVACSKLRNGERRPCCFNRNICCVPEVSKNGVLLELK